MTYTLYTSQYRSRSNETSTCKYYITGETNHHWHQLKVKITIQQYNNNYYNKSIFRVIIDTVINHWKSHIWLYNMVLPNSLLYHNGWIGLKVFDLAKLHLKIPPQHKYFISGLTFFPMLIGAQKLYFNTTYMCMLCIGFLSTLTIFKLWRRFQRKIRNWSQKHWFVVFILLSWQQTI